MRAYWTAQADGFDTSPGHRIRSEGEFVAYERLIRRFAPGLVGGEVLDAASGTGEVTRVLRRLDCRVTGVDLSEPMVEIARAAHAGDPNHPHDHGFLNRGWKRVDFRALPVRS